MRFYHYALPLVLLGFCLASEPPRTPPAVIKEVALKHSLASSEPFQWLLEVYRGTVTRYSPGTEGQQIPLPDSDWVCMTLDLTTKFTDKGSYMESRQIVCKLSGGQVVGSLTACTRDVNGQVDDNVQLLTLIDASGESQSLLLLCGANSEPSTTLESPKENQKGESDEL